MVLISFFYSWNSTVLRCIRVWRKIDGHHTAAKSLLFAISPFGDVFEKYNKTGRYGKALFACSTDLRSVFHQLWAWPSSVEQVSQVSLHIASPASNRPQTIARTCCRVFVSLTKFQPLTQPIPGQTNVSLSMRMIDLLRS